MLKSLVAAVVVLLPASVLSAQVDCRANVDSLFLRIEQNYPGVHLGRPDRGMITRLKTSAVKDAMSTAPDRCFPVLERVTAAFNDPHLFILQGERLDSLETQRRMATVQHVMVDEAALRARLSTGRHDPIEGIWYDHKLRLAVVPEPGTRGRYLAVVLTSDTATWNPGDVRAVITQKPDRSYRVDLAMRDHASRQLNGAIYRRMLLRLSPGMWGREFPVLPADSGSLDPVDAHRATWQLRGETGIVRIPSHDPTYVSALQTIGEQHMAEISQLKYLIIDLRGNEGGSSWVTTPILPLIRSAPPRPTRYVADSAVMLSTPAQIAYARRAFGPDTSAFVRSLVSRMEAAPGQFVPLRDPSRPKEVEPAGEISPRPLRVAVLVDRGTVSASEVLVLEALRSTRAVVIGEPTAGALDYQSVNVIRLSKDENRWFLGYPTIVRHPDIPAAERMQGIGIKPDIVVRWSEVGDAYGKAEEILSKQ